MPRAHRQHTLPVAAALLEAAYSDRAILARGEDDRVVGAHLRVAPNLCVQLLSAWLHGTARHNAPAVYPAGLG